MTRIRFDGCDLSPARGTPVAAKLASKMVTDTALAHRIAARRARSSPTAPRSPRARRARPRCPAELDAACPRRDRRRRRSTSTSARPGRPPRAASTSCHDRHRLREDARVQPAGARLARAHAEEPRALPLPDEGARAGPVPHAERAPRAAPAAGDLRRRHADRAALADPQVVERDPDQPGHGPRRAAAEPRALGRGAREPPLRRRRRGARLPRRVRLARRERAAPAAADRARSTAPSRSSCSRPRRSRTRASSRATLLGTRRRR